MTIAVPKTTAVELATSPAAPPIWRSEELVKTLTVPFPICKLEVVRLTFAPTFSPTDAFAVVVFRAPLKAPKPETVSVFENVAAPTRPNVPAILAVDWRLAAPTTFNVFERVAAPVTASVFERVAAPVIPIVLEPVIVPVIAAVFERVAAPTIVAVAPRRTAPETLAVPVTEIDASGEVLLIPTLLLTESINNTPESNVAFAAPKVTKLTVELEVVIIRELVNVVLPRIVSVPPTTTLPDTLAVPVTVSAASGEVLAIPILLLVPSTNRVPESKLTLPATV